jgi:hypothetical protein
LQKPQKVNPDWTSKLRMRRVRWPFKILRRLLREAVV